MIASPDPLLELLCARSFARRTVTLASGKTSDFFIDVKQTALLAEGHRMLGEALLRAIDGVAPEARAVAGVALGGCPLASAVSLMSGATDNPLDAIYVRKAVKDHGTQRRLEGGARLEPGAPVAIVEDVVTTGGSTLRAIAQIREEGFTVAGVVAVVDRREGGAKAIAADGHRFVALYGREDFLGDG